MGESSRPPNPYVEAPTPNTVVSVGGPLGGPKLDHSHDLVIMRMEPS